jgi:serine/arginine repetitive matrix protein 2
MLSGVDDTFSFLGHPQPRRQHADSDASGFCFKPANQTTRSHRQNELSNISFSSPGGPPISHYNHSFGHHRRNDLSASGSSIAHSYITHGVNGGRADWARYQQNASVESSMSDFSMAHCPGIGDKMFDTTHDLAAPLTAISASPSSSVADFNMANRTSV